LIRLLHGRQAHTAQIRDQLLRDLSAELASERDLLRRRRSGAGHLRGERRFGRNVGGVRREVVDDDAIGPSELRALVTLALSYLG
jgi:hypothetical protein